MKKSIVLLMCFSFIICGDVEFCFANDIVTGVVIEQSRNKDFIQVNDTIYLVTNVWQNDGENSVAKIEENSLTVGDVVQVYPGKKYVDYWTVEQIVQMAGEKKEEIIDKFALDSVIEQITKESHPFSQPEEKAVIVPSQLKLENGIWAN